MSDRGFLTALSCAFIGEAARWFRMERERMRSWKVFTKMFKDKYVGEYDQQDLYDDLFRRTQGTGEKVEIFLLNSKYIVSRFKRPPSEDKQVDLAYSNLLPEYHRAMSDKVVDKLDDIKRYGKRFKKQKLSTAVMFPHPQRENAYTKCGVYGSANAYESGCRGGK